MSNRDVSTNKNSSRRIYLLVVVVTSLAVSAIIFVGCKERFLFVIPGIVFIMSTVAVICLFGQVCCELISRTWPKSAGFIRYARIARFYLPAGGMHSGNSSPSYAYSLEVKYDYVVGGKWHNATRVSFVKNDYSSWKEAESARRRLLTDRTISVYYCPRIPSWSCIAHVKTRDIVIKLSAVATMSVVSLIFTLIAFYYLP